MKQLAEKFSTKIALIPITLYICNRTLPILGVTKIEQVEDAVKAMEIKLKNEEIS